jgi:hypothetical protein
VARPDSGQPLPAALSDFRAGRERLLAFLSGLAPEAWDRPAVHETLGATTLALQVQNIINHDLEHLVQLHQLPLSPPLPLREGGPGGLGLPADRSHGGV